MTLVIAKKEPVALSILTLVGLCMTAIFSYHSMAIEFSTQGRPWVDRFILLWILSAILISPILFLYLAINYVNLLRKKFEAITISDGYINIIEVFNKKIPISSVVGIRHEGNLIYIERGNGRSVVISSLGYIGTAQGIVESLRRALAA